MCYRRRILAELEGTALVAADHDNNIQEWCHTLLAKITCFRTLQTIYMPDAPQAIKDAEAAHDVDAPLPKPENIKLWMPSEMDPGEDGLHGCVPGLVEMEEASGGAVRQQPGRVAVALACQVFPD
jgi:hypothetical protein